MNPIYKKELTDDDIEEVRRIYRFGWSADGISRFHHWHPESVRQVIHAHMSPDDQVEHVRSRASWRKEPSEEKLIESLRSAGTDLGEDLSEQAYRAWYREHADACTPVALIRHFGGWSEARTAAFGAVNARKGGSRRQFSDDDLRKSLAAVATKIGWVPTQKVYDKERGAGMPSAILIRKRLGHWTRIRADIADATGLPVYRPA